MLATIGFVAEATLGKVEPAIGAQEVGAEKLLELIERVHADAALFAPRNAVRAGPAVWRAPLSRARKDDSGLIASRAGFEVYCEAVAEREEGFEVVLLDVVYAVYVKGLYGC